jgi:hypothetical protein
VISHSMAYPSREVATNVASIRHFETETYTWPMLAPDLRPSGPPWIATGLARELDWTRRVLTSVGFREDRS